MQSSKQQAQAQGGGAQLPPQGRGKEQEYPLHVRRQNTKQQAQGGGAQQPPQGGKEQEYPLHVRRHNTKRGIVQMLERMRNPAQFSQEHLEQFKRKVQEYTRAWGGERPDHTIRFMTYSSIAKRIVQLFGYHLEEGGVLPDLWLAYFSSLIKPVATRVLKIFHHGHPR